MPKRVFDDFLRKLVRDIQSKYSIGERYLTVREIAETFHVSLQTAQKGVTQLSEEGLIKGRQRAGIFITSHSRNPKIAGKKIIVLSNKQDLRFYHAFYEGVADRAKTLEVRTELKFNTFVDTASLDFGIYLTSLDADGIIALSFANSALPFYHALREGLDIVSDIIIDELPILPAIQTDNYLHASKAGKILIQNGYKNFYVFGYYPENNKRYKGFYEAVKGESQSVQYIHLSDFEAMARIDGMFHNLGPSTAVFSCDYSTNYIIASQFVKHRIKLKPLNFLAYDAETDFFHYPGLPPIRCVAPSFFNLGEALADMMLNKWKTGSFSETLQKKF